MSVAPVIQDVNQLWTAIYDESSSRFYYANVETSEVTWDKPQGYMYVSSIFFDLDIQKT